MPITHERMLALAEAGQACLSRLARIKAEAKAMQENPLFLEALAKLPPELAEVKRELHLQYFQALESFVAVSPEYEHYYTIISELKHFQSNAARLSHKRDVLAVHRARKADREGREVQPRTDHYAPAPRAAPSGETPEEVHARILRREARQAELAAKRAEEIKRLEGGNLEELEGPSQGQGPGSGPVPTFEPDLKAQRDLADRERKRQEGLEQGRIF